MRSFITEGGRRGAGLRLLQGERVTWGEGVPRRWDDWLKGVEREGNLEGLLHGAQRWFRGFYDCFFGGLNQKGSGRNGSKTRVLPWGHRIQLLAVIPFGSMMVPCFWVSTSRAFSSVSSTERKKGSWFGSPRARSFIKLLVKVPKAVSSWSPQIIQSSLLFFSHT